ncbi:AarF/ABC1/UbiB kinase family protein [Nocardia huaxiensis]|uniref:AarF/ABC1/UbiB kinase family protein n=1 Tax=Nocardia huaxiensis TaxID=2755382 RepID=A0A7D6YZ67_9NOCA|nr:AarF/ABC1/UbiB kinase family protein [Nocardia huaxiensis]QLY28046.1 AarF/ABC1/UbiB kinase family protein [Nocardia huaxiensis]
MTDWLGGTRRSRKFGSRPADPSGHPPAHPAARTVRLAALPIAYAGRHAAGLGKLLHGAPAETVYAEIRERTARHIFEVLGNLRGCAAKLGQILALYPGGLPYEIAGPYREALANLQFAAPPMLPGAVHAAMTQYLGPDWRDAFLEFDDRRPMAASIGQVHRAIWRDGTPVAVKIQYPGVAEAIESDLRQVRHLAFVAGVMLPSMDLDGLVGELCEGIRIELDYRREAENQRIAAEKYTDDPEFAIPRVVEQRAGVLVTEWLDGELLTTALLHGMPSETRDRVGASIFRFCMLSPARTGLIYCDPHPGNFVILPDGRLGVIDFGACTPQPPGFDDMIAPALEAALNGSADEFDALLRDYGFIPPGQDVDIAEFTRVLDPFVRMALEPTAEFSTEWLRARIGEGLSPRLDNVHRHLAMPPALWSYSRTLLSMVAVLAQLGATIPAGDIAIERLPEFEAIRARARARTAAGNGVSLRRV